MSTLKFVLRICILIAALVAVFYISSTNNHQVELNLAPGLSYSKSLAFIVLVSFSFGAAVFAVIAGWLGLKAYLKDRAFAKFKSKQDTIAKEYQTARDRLASDELIAAKAHLERILRRDPSNNIAFCDLIQTMLKLEEEPKEILRSLDEFRANHSLNQNPSAELLFNAAEINFKLGNKTAAVDNLVLILHSHKSPRAARMARDISEQLGKFEDAIQFHDTLGQFIDEYSKSDKQSLVRIKFQNTKAKALGVDTANLNQNSVALEQKQKYVSELKKFVKHNSEYIPALVELAKAEEGFGNISEASRLLLEAGRQCQCLDYWLKAAHLWIKAEQPERAIAALRSAGRELSGSSKIEAELQLIKLYLSLGMTAEAQKALEEFEVGSLSSEEQREELLILKGRCYSLSGNFEVSAEIWKKLAEGELNQGLNRNVSSKKVRLAPSPELSTP